MNSINTTRSARQRVLSRCVLCTVLALMGAGLVLRGNAVCCAEIPELTWSGRTLDLVIAGSGYFPVMQRNGNFVGFTRVGRFSISQDHLLVLKFGDVEYPYVPQIQVPTKTKQIVVSADGTFSVRVPGDNDLIHIAPLQLAQLPAVHALKRNQHGLLVGHCKDMTTGNPGLNGLGTIKQQYINTQVAGELSQGEKFSSIHHGDIDSTLAVLQD